MYHTTKHKFIVAGLVLAVALLNGAYAASGLDENGFLKPEVEKVEGCFGYMRLDNGVQVRVGDVYKNIIFYSPQTVRVNANLGRSYKKHPSLVTVSDPAAPSFSIREGGAALMIQSEKLLIEVDKTTGAVSFYRPDQSLIGSENKQHPSGIRKVEISGAPTYDVTQTFTLSDDESIYGLGQYNDRYMDYRGQKAVLIQTNIGMVVPLMISTRRYGIMWDAYSHTTFEDGPDGATFWSESSPAGVDYYFMAGDTMDED